MKIDWKNIMGWVAAGMAVLLFITLMFNIPKPELWVDSYGATWEVEGKGEKGVTLSDSDGKNIRVSYEEFRRDFKKVKR